MKPFSNSSELSNRITVERESGTKDEWGNPQWEEYLSAYAKVADRAGGETVVNSQNKRVSTAKTTFILRANPKSAGILPTMRIIWRGFIHEILTPTIFSDDRNFVSVETLRRY